MICSRCKKDKEESDFNFRHKKENTRHSYCKICSRAYGKTHYYKNTKYYNDKSTRRGKKQRLVIKEYIVSYLLAHPCVDCGESDIRCLDFDHVRYTKSFDVSLAQRHLYSMDTIQKEIDKCEIRCANCHRKVTHSRRAHVSALPSKQLTVTD